MSFKILCIDGGGVRGIFPAHLVSRIEESLGLKVNESFDMVVGTSTGSIIASSIAVDYPLKDVVSLFHRKSQKIFQKKPFSMGGLIKSRYDADELEELLELILGSRTLSETKVRLIIPATDIGNGNVHVFKSNYLKEFVRDVNVKIADAVVASCAAPTFFNPKTVGAASYMLADGGLWANNPSMVALTEAIGKLGIDRNEVKILSIGTGSTRISYDIADVNNTNWGFLRKWKGQTLIHLMLHLQSVSDTNRTQLILGNNYLRLNWETDKKLPMDNPKILKEMRNRADYVFTYNSEKIKTFLDIGKEQS